MPFASLGTRGKSGTLEKSHGKGLALYNQTLAPREVFSRLRRGQEGRADRTELSGAGNGRNPEDSEFAWLRVLNYSLAL